MGGRLNICFIHSQDSFCTVRIYFHALLCLLLSAHVTKQMAMKTKNWWIRKKDMQDFLHYACSICLNCKILPNKIYESWSSAYTKIRRLQAEGRIEPCKDHANKRDDGTMYSAEQLCGGCLRPWVQLILLGQPICCNVTIVCISAHGLEKAVVFKLHRINFRVNWYRRHKTIFFSEDSLSGICEWRELSSTRKRER